MYVPNVGSLLSMGRLGWKTYFYAVELWRGAVCFIHLFNKCVLIFYNTNKLANFLQCSNQNVLYKYMCATQRMVRSIACCAKVCPFLHGYLWDLWYVETSNMPSTHTLVTSEWGNFVSHQGFLKTVLRILHGWEYFDIVVTLFLLCTSDIVCLVIYLVVDWHLAQRKLSALDKLHTLDVLGHPEAVENKEKLGRQRCFLGPF